MNLFLYRRLRNSVKGHLEAVYLTWTLTYILTCWLKPHSCSKQDTSRCDPLQSQIIVYNGYNMASQVRQNFHLNCEEALNNQVNLDLTSSYVYQAISFYFDRDDLGLPGMQKFFKALSDEKRNDAEKVNVIPRVV